MEKISIQEYIAYNNRPMAQKMLVKYGLKTAKNPNEMERKLISLTRDYKEEFLKELANIHPDKELILKYADKKEEKSNFCGCSGFDGEKSNFCGCSGFVGEKSTESKPTEPKSTESKNSVFKNENLGIILVAGLLAITIVAIAKK
jgi:hypothetical protein